MMRKSDILDQSSKLIQQENKIYPHINLIDWVVFVHLYMFP